MKKIEMFKRVGELIVSVGVTSIVTNAVRVTTPLATGQIQRFCIGVGGLILGGMLSDKAVSYTEEKFNQSLKEVNNMAKNGELE